MGKTVNQTELAAIFGKSDVTIWEWQKEGLPMLHQGVNGTANQYDTEACIAWYAAREVAKVAKDTPRDRLLASQARLAELDVAERENKLVPVDQIEPVWQSRVFAAAAFMLAQPSRLAGMLEGAAGMEAKREILRGEFKQFLAQLGVDGERMEQDVKALLERLSEADAAAFIARLTKGHGGDQSDPASAARAGLGDVRPGSADPPVGVG